MYSAKQNNYKIIIIIIIMMAKWSTGSTQMKTVFIPLIWPQTNFNKIPFFTLLGQFYIINISTFTVYELRLKRFIFEFNYSVWFSLSRIIAYICHCVGNNFEVYLYIDYRVHWGNFMIKC